MEGCATAHDAGYGPADTKSPDGSVRLVAAALVLATLDPPAPAATRRALPPPAGPAPIRAPTHLTPLRL
jgi:hypothetical protein